MKLRPTGKSQDCCHVAQNLMLHTLVVKSNMRQMKKVSVEKGGKITFRLNLGKLSVHIK